jgi:phosphatidylglycerophosphatase A
MSELPAADLPPRPSLRFMVGHPAHLVAFGFGCGLSPIAPGTVGTLWAWLVFVLAEPWLGDAQWALVIAIALLVGWWACTRTARDLGASDPGAIVWDEVVAFWLVLWLLMPARFGVQLTAFLLFRVFDMAKPGPIGWVDRHFKLPLHGAIGWREGFGNVADDLAAALATLLVMALVVTMGRLL